MTNTNKAFNQLSDSAKKARLAKYAEQDAKYGLKEALFRVTHVSRHENRTFNAGTDKEQTVASFGYNVVPVKGYDKADFEMKEDGTPKFTWVNQLINIATGSKVIDAMEQLAKDTSATEDGKNPSVLVSIKYRKNAKGYINVNSVFRRDKKSAPAQAPKASAQPATDETELPY